MTELTLNLNRNDLTYLEELTSILITSVESVYASMNSNICSNSEVNWHEWSTRSILLEDHLSLEEGSLGNS